MDQRVELSAEQISVLLQIINKGTYVGEQVEIVAILKQTLIMMLQQKQTIVGGQQPSPENKPAE